jgi:hypothetical protein
MPLALDEIYQAIADVLAPRHFFVAAPAELEWQGPLEEEVPWELFRGRLLDPAHSRLRHVFLSWNLFWTDELGRSTEPVLAVKFDKELGQLHVVRAVLCYAWEGYDAGGNVYLSRETTKWVRELVGTIALDQVQDAEHLRRELADWLFRAVVGTSRLPLTSVESPLPAFSLGRLAYFRAAGEAGLMRTWRELATRPQADLARALEAVLRAVPPTELTEAAQLLGQRWSESKIILGRLRTLFNEVALSPWTGFADNVLGFVQALGDQGKLSQTDEMDFLGWLLRQLGRHLTAYDLITFHHRGANYPDALLLDAALKRYLTLVDTAPDLFAAAGPRPQRQRLRRRALRQAWLLRRHYEGLPVPDAPTSTGESMRVLPPPHRRVPLEQITQPGKRKRRLYEGDPLERYLSERARAVLQQSVCDLEHPDELRELGLGLFVDRPLGVFKHPLEPDNTLLLSYEAFSRSLAEARLAELGRLLGPLFDPALYREALRQLEVRGLPLAAVQCEERRIVSLADLGRAAADFVLLRTTRQAVADFLAEYEMPPLDFLADKEALIVPAPVETGSSERILLVYDLHLRKRLELAFGGQGYEVQAGRERPRGGLRILHVWE